MTNVAEQLHDFIEHAVDPVMFPYQKGSKINIGSYSIIKGKHSYTIKSYKTNAVIEETFSKTAAVAIAKSLNKKVNATRKIKQLDELITKHYLDCVFFKNIIKKCKDDFRLDIIQVRYDISLSKMDDARRKIEYYIF